MATKKNVQRPTLYALVDKGNSRFLISEDDYAQVALAMTNGDKELVKFTIRELAGDTQEERDKRITKPTDMDITMRVSEIRNLILDK